MELRRQLTALALAGYARLLTVLAEGLGDETLSPRETAAQLEELIGAIQGVLPVIASWRTPPRQRRRRRAPLPN